MSPNLEERFTSAAYTILTDDHPHERAAMAWAARFLRRAARGKRTEFQASLSVLTRENGLRGKRANSRKHPRRTWS